MRACLLVLALAGPVMAGAQERPRTAASSETGGYEAPQRIVPSRGAAGGDERPRDRREARPSVPERPVPNYGALPPADDPAEELLWIPRILFFPLHFAIEYVVRRPVGWLLRTIELERLDAGVVPGMPQAEQRREGRWWFVPLLRYDHGFQPSVGLGFRAHDREQRLSARLRLEGLPDDRIAGAARGSVRIGSALLALDLDGGYREDRIDHGLGWDSPASSRARYTDAYGSAGLFVEARPWRRSVIAGGVRTAVHRFGNSDYLQAGDRSIDAAIALGEVERPPGYPEGYTVVEPWARAVLDTRAEGDWPNAGGVRAELFVAWSVDAERSVRASWARLGGHVELALALLHERALGVRGLVEIVEPLAHRAIPFTEQVVLGGALDRMPGFLAGRLVGSSGAVLGVSWRYAIWPWMDAELFVETGNVFGAHFEDFAFDRLRLSFGTAIVTRDPDDLTVLLAFGTEPFARGTDVTSVRFALSIGAPP